MKFRITPEMVQRVSPNASAFSASDLEALNLEIEFWQNDVIRAVQAENKTSCPYCALLIDPAAVVCSQCKGLLSIGSTLSIRTVITINPTLAILSEETVQRLSECVAFFDEEFLKQSESERQERERVLALEAENRRIEEAKRAAEQLEQRRAAADRREAEFEEERRAREEQLAGMNPIARLFMKNAKAAQIIIGFIVAIPLAVILASHAIEAHNKQVQEEKIAKQKLIEERHKLLVKKHLAHDAQCRKIPIFSDSNRWIWELQDLKMREVVHFREYRPEDPRFGDYGNEWAGYGKYKLQTDASVFYSKPLNLVMQKILKHADSAFSDSVHPFGRTFAVFNNIKYKNWSDQGIHGGKNSRTSVFPLLRKFDVTCKAVVAKYKKMK